MASDTLKRPLNGMISLMTQGPWGHRGGSGNGGGNNGGNDDGPGPWGGGQRPRGGGGGGNNDPDLDEMLRQAQDRFRNTFGGKRPSGDVEPGRAMLFLVAVLAAIWLFTGFYTVQPQENALILTFGKVTDTKTDAGLGYHLPVPIQDDIKVDVTRVNQIDVGFSEGSGGARTDVQRESIMLTGDQNIVNIHFSVRWHVGNAKQYKFDIYDPDATVKKVAESAMREVIGQTTIQSAMTEGRAAIESKTKDLMQSVLDSYKSGVIINSVLLLSVDPPTQAVVDAFNDVQRARTDKERAKNEAETYQNNIVPVAKGDAQKIIQDAEAYKASTVAKAQGDADRFLSVYKAYAESKDVTERRIYIETMQDVLKNSRKVIMGDTKSSGLLPWMQVGAQGGRTPVTQ